MAEKEKLDLGLDSPQESDSPIKKMILLIIATMLVTLILVFTTLYILGIFPPKHEEAPQRIRQLQKLRKVKRMRKPQTMTKRNTRRKKEKKATSLFMNRWMPSPSPTRTTLK